MKRAIEINFNLGKDFKPKVKHGIVWMFYLSFSLFFCIGITVAIIIGKESYLAVLSMLGFVLLLFLLVWLQTSALLVRYHVNPKGLYIKRSWLKRLYYWDDIKAIVLLSEKEAKNIAQNLDDIRVDALNELDVVDSFSGRMKFGKLTQFSSIQFIGVETRGSGHKVLGNRIMTSGEFILMSLKNGNNHFITPEDTGSYFQEIEMQSGGYFNKSASRLHALTASSKKIIE